MNDLTITITKKEYDELIEKSNFLNALQRAGVNNWEGYGFAQDIFNNDYLIICSNS